MSKYKRKHKDGSQEKGYKQTAQKVLQHMLKYPTKPLNHNQLGTALQFRNPNEKEHLIKVLSKLAGNNQIKEIEPGKFQLNLDDNTAIGTIDFTTSGASYVTVEGIDDDVYIPKGKSKNALQNDLVKLMFHETKGKKREGSIIEILQRNKTQFVGVIEIVNDGKYGFVNVDQTSLHVDIFIGKKYLEGLDVKNGQKVIADIIDWPEDADSPFGKIIEVLGDAGDHDVEIHAILAEYGLPSKFPEEVEKEANELNTSIQADEIKKRRDMRDVPTFTIDPKDAKDFDDALSIQKLENGNWEIGVHIADVAHYVQPGTLLDKEAYKRATSVYLVDRVVPMLPEVLSNQACSLRPNEEKYTFSAVFELDDNAKLVKNWFGRTVTYSDRRFAYEEAQEIIEGKDGDFKDEILTLDRLAKIMRKQRMKNGAISFDRVEVKFKLDEDGNPLGVYFKESKDANKLIEEFMLLANMKVSEYVSLNKNGKDNKNTFIYRIHDNPNPEKLLSLKQFIKQFGYSLNIGDKKETSNSINELLQEVKGKGEENMIETLTMRSMSKAIYSTENIGHYGLAFDYYSHFTSPIRRYPDVIAHRLLQHYLEGGKSPNPEPYEEDCVHCSQRERLAADAERDSTKYMQVKFLADSVGEEYDGLISGVTEWGIYIELPLSRAEGLVKLKNIRDDHYIFDKKNYAIVGQKSNKSYRLGDEVRVKLVNVDLERKQMDFEIVR